MRLIISDSNFIKGVFIELISVVLCVYITNSIYWGGGFPFVQIFFAVLYILGAHFIFKSNVTLFFKITAVFWWVALVIFSLVYLLIVYNVESFLVKEETYLIPKGYHGEVVVEYNKPDGAPPIFEENSVVFRVQIDGKTSTSYKRRFNGVYTNNVPALFFYLDDAGNRLPIKLASDPTVLPDEVSIHDKSYDHDGNEIFNSNFLVLTKSEHDIWYRRK